MKTNQKAGNNSTQIQTENINIGLTESEVRNIIQKEIELALSNAKLVAGEVAKNRMNEFANVLLPKLVKGELLDSFSDPVIIYSFRNAEKTATCTDRDLDYEILSELLVHKINRRKNYTKSASIEKAISEINNISEEALMTLTILFAIETYSPVTGTIRDGLKVLDNLYGKLLNGFVLPQNSDWIDNLEVTGCIRINSISNYKRLDDFYFESLSGYAVLGIKKDSDEYKKALDLLTQNNLPIQLLIENELDNKYRRLPLVSTESIKGDNLSIICEAGVPLNIKLSKEQIEALKEIVSMYDKTNEKLIKEKFYKILEEFKNIKTILNWWNNFLVNNAHMSINSIGKVLAHTNAKRIDNKLPDLD